MEITLHRPGDLPPASLGAVCRLLLDAGEVANGLEGRLKTVIAFALLREGETILGVAAIKRRRPRYAAKLSQASGFDELGTCRRELGYVCVVPELRGRGYGRRLIAAALARAGGEPLFATTRTDDPAIAHILRRFGFMPVGRAWRSERGPELILWVTADWRAAETEGWWTATARRLRLGRRSAPKPPTALLVSFGHEDWTTVRLAGALKTAGFAVAVAAPFQSVAMETRTADRLFPFGGTAGSRWRSRLLLRQIMAAADATVIVPINHRAVAFLHHVAETMARRPAAVRERLGRSLGDVATISDRLLKHRTMARARSIGVRTPAGGTVATVEEAAAFARGIGFPVVLKAAFGAGGDAVLVCRTTAELEAGFPRLVAGTATSGAPQSRPPAWLPSHLPIDIQAFIDGRPAMSCAVAKEGRVLAVLSAVAVETLGASGPSSVVRLVSHPEIERMTAAMVADFRASGFVSFDFLLDRRTGDPYLVECNPRPIAIAPLGRLVGCDLMKAFRHFVAGTAVAAAPETARSELTVALFPRELVRDPESPYLATCFHDVPADEPAALEMFLAARGPMLPDVLRPPETLDAAE